MMRSIIGSSLRFRRLGIGRAAAALIFVLSASACVGANPDRVTGGSNSNPEQATAKDFDPNRFDRSPNIDNKWLPEKPGTQFVYEGSAINDDGRRISRRVVTTITDLTKVIDGVRTVVIWDRDYDNGRLVEGEIAFHAQDNDGNVWLLGEYPEEYEEGRFVGAPSTWIAGMEGAKPGILMRATPRPGTSSYSQGLAPASEFTDRAEVYKVDQKTCVPVDCYQNVLVTSEWDTAHPEEGVQRKYHAPGVGYVRVGFKPGDEEEETLVLEKIRHLSPEALAEVRQQALKLDKRAYEHSSEVYRETPPAEHTLLVEDNVGGSASASATANASATPSSITSPSASSSASATSSTSILPASGGVGTWVALAAALALMGCGIGAIALVRRSFT